MNNYPNPYRRKELFIFLAWLTLCGLIFVPALPFFGASDSALEGIPYSVLWLAGVTTSFTVLTAISYIKVFGPSAQDHLAQEASSCPL
jgi:hypothetical protein